MRTRTLWLLSVLATALVVVVTVLVTPDDDGTPTEGPTERPTPLAAGSPTSRAVALLRAWDRRRARAWARDDAAALRALYVRGSRTGRRDLAMLGAYHRRGLRVTTMQRQVLAVEVRANAPREVRLLVTDRLVEGRVTTEDRQVVLPRSRPAVHRIVMRLSPTGWRVAEVYDA